MSCQKKMLLYCFDSQMNYLYLMRLDISNYKIFKEMFKTILIVSLLYTCSLAVQPRSKAFQFTAQAVLPDLSFKSISLSDYAGKYVVLLFYPFDFTYVCPT